jgi:hypothetical protein
MKGMSVDEFMKAVDHAAGMNDRWLFIASLVVIGCFGIWVMRYFVKQHARLLDDHRQSREMYQKSLQSVVAEQSAANAKLILCLEANTQVLGQCRDELRRRRSRRPASQNKQQKKGCKA